MGQIELIEFLLNVFTETMLVVNYDVMLFMVNHDVAMNYVFQKFINHSCQGYWYVVRSFCPVSFLENCCYVCFFPGFGDFTEDWKISCIIGVRWEAGLFRNHGGMSSGPCDLDMLIVDSWSCTPLSEIVSLGILSFRFGNFEFPSCVKTFLK